MPGPTTNGHRLGALWYSRAARRRLADLWLTANVDGAKDLPSLHKRRRRYDTGRLRCV